MDCPIPLMDDPLSVYWDQPSHNQLFFTEEAVIVPRHAFNALKEYSSSNPSGAYHGKMWKCYFDGQWELCWFGIHPTDPKLVTINRMPLIVDDVGITTLMGG